jgi:hypothetical protein
VKALPTEGLKRAVLKRLFGIKNGKPSIGRRQHASAAYRSDIARGRRGPSAHADLIADQTPTTSTSWSTPSRSPGLAV